MANKSKIDTEVKYRSSVSGQFVRQDYAKSHPATTERQHIRKPTTSSISTSRSTSSRSGSRSR